MGLGQGRGNIPSPYGGKEDIQAPVWHDEKWRNVVKLYSGVITFGLCAGGVLVGLLGVIALRGLSEYAYMSV